VDMISHNAACHQHPIPDLRSQRRDLRLDGTLVIRLLDHAQQLERRERYDLLGEYLLAVEPAGGVSDGDSVSTTHGTVRGAVVRITL
jgi:hypothetical protein